MSRGNKPLRETMPELKKSPDHVYAAASQSIAENNSPVAPASNPEPDPMRVMVDREQLQALIAQNAELKGDIGTFVSVFDGLQGMFTGKGGLMSIIPVITKLLNDKNKMQELSAIVPVMNKYTQKTETNGIERN